MKDRKHLERQLLKHLHHVVPGLHHALTGPKGPEHALMILGGLVVLLVLVSIFGPRTSRG